ncbi:MAG TPA: acylphosphatase [Blastocatellia bacterium]|nr:acylphosphatase [Blastocatellia bacterium]
MTIARRFIVRGRVQGVGFRYFAIRAARGLGIVGTVCNMPDGSVEAIAEGETEAILEFRRDLERGPSYSQVTAVEESELDVTGRYKSFEVVSSQ